MDLLRPTNSPSIEIKLAPGSTKRSMTIYSGPDRTGGLISFSYNLQSGTKPSSGSMKITHKALIEIAAEDKEFFDREIVTDELLTDHSFISQYLKSFDVTLSDGFGNDIKFTKLTATKLDFDDLGKEANAQVVSIPFVDHRWKLEEHGVFLRCNCTVGNKFEEHWFSPDSMKPDRSPYTYRDVLKYLVTQIEISDFNGNVILNKEGLPKEYIEDGKTSDYIPEVYDIINSEDSDLDREVSDIEWTGQPLSKCIDDICGDLGLIFSMLPNGDVYFYKTDSYYGLPDFDFDLPEGGPESTSGLISLSGGLEGPRVPENIIVVGARKRDQIRVFPSMDFKVPEAWKRPDMADSYSKYVSSFGFTEGSHGRKEVNTVSVSSAGMMPISEDWPSGKVRDLDVVADNWNIKLEEFMVGYMPAKREKVLLDMLKEAKSQIDLENEKNLEPELKEALDAMSKKYRDLYNNYLSAYYGFNRTNPQLWDPLSGHTSVERKMLIDENGWAQLYEDGEIVKISEEATSFAAWNAQDDLRGTEEYQRYQDLLQKKKQYTSAQSFEILAKKAIMQSQWFRWYRLPDFVEVKYDSESVKAREEYIAKYPEHAKWTEGATAVNTGGRGNFTIRELFLRNLGPITTGRKNWDDPSMAEDQIVISGPMITQTGAAPVSSTTQETTSQSASRLSDEERNTAMADIKTIVVPYHFVTPWLKELNEPYWSFKRDPGEAQTLVDQVRQNDDTKKTFADLTKDKGRESNTKSLKDSFPEPTRSEPFVWAFSASRALFAAGFEQPLYPALTKHRQVDTERGYILFNEELPGPRLITEQAEDEIVNLIRCSISEQVPYNWPLVGVEFCYERKDPSLGIHNFYTYKLPKESAPKYIYEIIKSTPAALRHEKYIKMSELVEMLYDGISLNKRELDNLVLNSAKDIWKAAARGTHGSSQFALAFLRVGAPNNKLSNISWSYDNSGVKTNFSIGSEVSGRSIEQILQAQILRMKKLELEKTPYKYSYRASPSIADAISKGEGGFSAHMPPLAVGSWNDENLKLVNSLHFGLMPIYDPEQDEDVLFCQATLADKKLHLHVLDKVGPYLCKKADPRKGSIPIRGYSWWADGEHKAGGHWYPYILLPVDYDDGPTPPPDPITTADGGGRGVPVPGPGGDWSETGRWEVPDQGFVAPLWYTWDENNPQSGPHYFPSKVPDKRTLTVAQAGIHFPKTRSTSVTFAGQWTKKSNDDDSGPMKTIDGFILSAGAHIVMTYNNEASVDDACARFRLYIASAWPGDPLDLDSLAELCKTSPERIFVKDFNLPIRGGEHGTAVITGPIKLPPAVTSKHAQYIAILARMSDSHQDTFDGSIVMTDFKWVAIDDTSEFSQEPVDYTIPYENPVEDCVAPSLDFDISIIDIDNETVYVSGDCSIAITPSSYFEISNNMCQNGQFQASTVEYMVTEDVTKIVLNTGYSSLSPSCPDTASGNVAPFIP